MKNTEFKTTLTTGLELSGKDYNALAEALENLSPEDENKISWTGEKNITPVVEATPEVVDDTEEKENERVKKEKIQAIFAEIRLSAEREKILRKEKKVIGSRIKALEAHIEKLEEDERAQELKQKTEDEDTKIPENEEEVEEENNFVTKSQILQTDLDDLSSDKSHSWQIDKSIKKKEEQKKLERKIQRERDLEEAERQKIEEDKKAKPFDYFLLKKALSLRNLHSLENPQIGGVDLLNLRKNFNSTSPYEFENKNFYAYTEVEGEGFYDFNIFGFVKIIKNISQLEKDGGINYKSPEAIYKIVGPDNTTIEDNIHGYEQATKIYNEETEKYKNEVEEEFNNLKTK